MDIVERFATFQIETKYLAFLSSLKKKREKFSPCDRKPPGKKQRWIHSARYRGRAVHAKDAREGNWRNVNRVVH